MKIDLELPLWIQPVELKDWETKIIESSDLGYKIPLPSGWENTPQINKTSFETEHRFSGNAPRELLSISFIEKANPNDNICNWVEAILNITKFPILAWQSIDNNPPILLEWNRIGACRYLEGKLAVDETYLYQGLAQFNDRIPNLYRFYIVLARRNNFAWKISLSLSSACLPGTPQEMIERNDSVRAGAIFGGLSLCID